MNRFFALCALLFAVACIPAGQSVTRSAEEIARDQAKTVINGVVERQLPGVDVSAATDCIIDNATLPEIFSIAKASVTGPDQSTIDTVLKIGQRPEAVRCLLGAALPMVGALTL